MVKYLHLRLSGIVQPTKTAGGCTVYGCGRMIWWFYVKAEISLTQLEQALPKNLPALIYLCTGKTTACQLLPLCVWAILITLNCPGGEILDYIYVHFFSCSYLNLNWWQYFQETPSCFLPLWLSHCGSPTSRLSLLWFFLFTPQSVAHSPSATSSGVFDPPAPEKNNSHPVESIPVVAMATHLDTDAIATLFLWPWGGNGTAGVQVEVEPLTPATQLNGHFHLSACKLTQSVNTDLDPHA